jgi:hypothetical protein
MVDWNKDRNRQLKKRAQAEEVEEKVNKWSAGPGRFYRPPPSKAMLRAIGEDLVRQYENRRRRG